MKRVRENKVDPAGDDTAAATADGESDDRDDDLVHAQPTVEKKARVTTPPVGQQQQQQQRQQVGIGKTASGGDGGNRPGGGGGGGNASSQNGSSVRHIGLSRNNNRASAGPAKTAAAAPPHGSSGGTSGAPTKPSIAAPARPSAGSTHVQRTNVQPSAEPDDFCDPERAAAADDDDDELPNIPFITEDESRVWQAHDEACRLIAEAPGELGLVAIVGRYRSGKSFLGNIVRGMRVGRVSDRKDGGGGDKVGSKFSGRVVAVRPTDVGRGAERKPGRGGDGSGGDEQKGGKPAAVSSGGGFVVSNRVESQTKGLWILPYLLAIRLADGTLLDVVLIDTEGLGDPESNRQKDMRILLICFMLCSLVVYNSMGAVDESAIEQLSMITELAKHLRMDRRDAKTTSGGTVADPNAASDEKGETKGSGGGGTKKAGDDDHDGDDDSDSAVEARTPEQQKEFDDMCPSLLWAARDFALEDDDSAASVDDQEFAEPAVAAARSNAYLEKQMCDRRLPPAPADADLAAAAAADGDADRRQRAKKARADYEAQRDEVRRKNELRRNVRAYFPRRECVRMRRPATDELGMRRLGTLGIAGTRPEFRHDVRTLEHQIRACLHPKRLMGRAALGPAIVASARAVVAALNAGRVLVVRDAMASAAAEQLVAAKYEAFKHWDDRLRDYFRAQKAARLAHAAPSSSSSSRASGPTPPARPFIAAPASVATKVASSQPVSGRKLLGDGGGGGGATTTTTAAAATTTPNPAASSKPNGALVAAVVAVSKPATATGNAPKRPGVTSGPAAQRGSAAAAAAATTTQTGGGNANAARPLQAKKASTPTTNGAESTEGDTADTEGGGGGGESDEKKTTMPVAAIVAPPKSQPASQLRRPAAAAAGGKSQTPNAASTRPALASSPPPPPPPPPPTHVDEQKLATFLSGLVRECRAKFDGRALLSVSDSASRDSQRAFVAALEQRRKACVAENDRRRAAWVHETLVVHLETRFGELLEACAARYRPAATTADDGRPEEDDDDKFEEDDGDDADRTAPTFGEFASEVEAGVERGGASVGALLRPRLSDWAARYADALELQLTGVAGRHRDVRRRLGEALAAQRALQQTAVEACERADAADRRAHQSALECDAARNSLKDRDDEKQRWAAMLARATEQGVALKEQCDAELAQARAAEADAQRQRQEAADAATAATDAAAVAVEEAQAQRAQLQTQLAAAARRAAEQQQQIEQHAATLERAGAKTLDAERRLVVARQQHQQATRRLADEKKLAHDALQKQQTTATADLKRVGDLAQHRERQLAMQRTEHEQQQVRARGALAHEKAQTKKVEQQLHDQKAAHEAALDHERRATRDAERRLKVCADTSQEQQSAHAHDKAMLEAELRSKTAESAHLRAERQTDKDRLAVLTLEHRQCATRLAAAHNDARRQVEQNETAHTGALHALQLRLAQADKQLRADKTAADALQQQILALQRRVARRKKAVGGGGGGDGGGSQGGAGGGGSGDGDDAGRDADDDGDDDPPENMSADA